MSFTTDQKDLILSEHIRTSCCLKALFEGVLFSCGFLKNDEVHLIVPKDIAPYLQNYANDLFSIMFENVAVLPGGKKIEVSMHSASSKRFIQSFQDGVLSPSEKCAMCFSYFLKGVFLTCGMVSDPSIEFRIEFTLLRQDSRIGAFVDLIREYGIELKETKRHGQIVLYTKRSSSLEDFFALANMNQVTFALMNYKIEHEIRNNANRISNCEMSNIEKAVTASSRHLAVITELSEAGLLSSLPEELEQTARLRLENPDLSAAQLAAMMTPAITKSGLVHRLNRIIKMANEMLGSVK